MPCCQGFTLEIDGGEVVTGAQSIQHAWTSENFDRLRRAHRERTWDREGKHGEPICRHCAVTKKPTPIAIEV
jgi:hypothetical protein